MRVEAIWIRRLVRVMLQEVIKDHCYLHREVWYWKTSRQKTKANYFKKRCADSMREVVRMPSQLMWSAFRSPTRMIRSGSLNCYWCSVISELSVAEEWLGEGVTGIIENNLCVRGATITGQDVVEGNLWAGVQDKWDEFIYHHCESNLNSVVVADLSK